MLTISRFNAGAPGGNWKVARAWLELLRKQARSFSVRIIGPPNWQDDREEASRPSPLADKAAIITRLIGTRCFTKALVRSTLAWPASSGFQAVWRGPQVAT